MTAKVTKVERLIAVVPCPWFDVRRTMQLISEATPPHFAIDAD